jgi:hypothetical protein
MRSAYLYIVILLVLTNIFTFSYYSKNSEFVNTRYEKLKEKSMDSITVLGGMLIEANHFTIDRNHQAQDYFDDVNTGRYIHFDEIKKLIGEKILESNNNENGNPFTNYDAMNGKGFKISKYKVINHRWVVADFSNGDLNGQVLLQYFIDENQTVDFEVIQSVIYVN